MRFRYWCTDAAGQSRDGVIEARSPEQAERKLRKRNLQILVLEPEGPVRPEPVPEPAARQSHRLLKPRDRLMFHLQMGVMLKAGVPLAEAFQALMATDSEELRGAAFEVSHRIMSGASLSQAMAGCRHFDPVAISLVRAAEASGALTEMFGRLADRLRALIQRRQRLVSALTYPAVIGLVCLGLLALLLGYMLPQFVEVFSSLGVELPWLTRFFMGLATGPWLPLAAILTVLSTGGTWLAYHRVEAARFMVQRMVYETPGIGPPATKGLLARLTSDLALMIDLGVSVDECLGLLRKPTCGYYLADEALRVAQVELRGTGDLVAALRESGMFPPVLVQMALVGLETGRLGEFLRHYSRLAEMDFDITLNDSLNLLEPLILMFLGGGVGLVVLSAFLPLYELLSQF